MLTNFKTLAIAATVSLAGLASTAPSSAQDIQFLIGPDGVRVRTADYCERNRDDRRCRDYMRDRRDGDRRDGDRRWGRDDDRRRGCSADDAVDAARERGVRRARVVDQGRRTIEVAGMSRRGPVVYTFSRERGCPVLDRDYRERPRF